MVEYFVTKGKLVVRNGAPLGEIKKIDRNVVEKLINKMIVNKEGGVEIQWTFKEIFQSA